MAFKKLKCIKNKKTDTDDRYIEKWPNERMPNNRSEEKEMEEEKRKKKHEQPMWQGNSVNRDRASQTEQQATHNPLVG